MSIATHGAEYLFRLNTEIWGEKFYQYEEVNSRITFTALLGKRSPRTSYL